MFRIMTSTAMFYYNMPTSIAQKLGVTLYTGDTKKLGSLCTRSIYGGCKILVIVYFRMSVKNIASSSSGSGSYEALSVWQLIVTCSMKSKNNLTQIFRDSKRNLRITNSLKKILEIIIRVLKTRINRYVFCNDLTLIIVSFLFNIDSLILSTVFYSCKLILNHEN